ncbi:hypothetical protein BDN72DRAFT_615953 [Pluteus cervinus]|uniref:Uncharacterized protein n=1 Tax=Pluteus cervinus TaxID=181527 RepID=A0ACD3AUV0_9AGAR|nr:hypothetical protein BDN72DRAFT_615953 [Pluteus cervinus]
MFNTLPPFSIQGLSTEEAFGKIDAEIQQVIAKLAYLRNLRNSLLPIYQFSDDVLSEIFLHCHDDDKGRPHEREQPHSRLLVSWISHRWRNVALSTSRLWCLVANVGSAGSSPKRLALNLHYAQECMIRSARVGIELSLWVPPKQLLSLCMSRISLVRKLNIRFDRIADQPLINVLWTREASSLVSLSLEGVVFPEGDHIFPHLETIDLNVCSFHWGSTFLRCSTITKLHISRPRSKVSFIHLINNLRALPSLADALFWGTLRESVNSDVPTPLRLPSLRTITIGEHRDPMFSFLRALEIPQAHVILHMITSGPPGRRYRYAFESFLTAFRDYQRALSLPISYLEAQDSTYFQISSFPGNINWHTVHVPHSGEASLMSSVFQELDHNDLEMIVADDFVFGMACLPKLRVVQLSGEHAVDGLVTSLQRCDRSPQVMFPALQELVFRRVNQTIGPPMSKKLYDVLHSREDRGLHLRKLVFVESDSLWDGSTLGRLRGMIDDVVVL